jgi:Putative transmembrane protein (PGPGW)
MTPSDTAVPPRASKSGSAPADGLGRPVAVPRASRRDRIRSKPGLGPAYRIGVFVAGLACIALGFALAVLPGPLTIPPVLLGLWIWSTEFAFAERFFDSFKRKAREAWAHAKRRPASSAAITVGGLVLAGVAFWAVGHFELVAKGKDVVGM